MRAWLDRARPVALALYAVALLTSLSAMEIVATVLCLIAALSLWLSPESRPSLKELPFLWPMLAFVLVVIAGVLLNESSLAQKRYDIGRMRFFLLYAALWITLLRVSKDSVWARALALTALPLCLYGTIQHFFPVDWIRPEGKKTILYAIPEENRGPLVLGAFNHHLTFANVVSLHAFLLLGWGLAQKPRWPWALLSGWLLLLCLWTGSRMAWAALPLSGATFALLYVGKRRAIAVAGAIAVLIGAVFALTPEFRQRASRLWDTGNFHASAGPRLRLWRANWEMFKDHPILGVGYNGNERRAKEYLDRLYPTDNLSLAGHAHSNPLQILSSTGILGAAAFLWLWIAVALRLARVIRAGDERSRALAIGLAAAFVAFHLQGLAQWNFGDAEVLHSVMFCLAVTATLPPRDAGSSENFRQAVA